MRSYANRHRILIVFTVMVVVVGSLWWTKTIAFTRSLAISFSSEPFQLSTVPEHWTTLGPAKLTHLRQRWEGDFIGGLGGDPPVASQ